MPSTNDSKEIEQKVRKRRPRKYTFDFKIVKVPVAPENREIWLRALCDLYDMLERYNIEHNESEGATQEEPDNYSI